MRKKWIPALVAAVLVVGLAVCAVFVALRPPAEDKSETLSRELATLVAEGDTLRDRQKSQQAQLDQLGQEEARLEALQAKVEREKERYTSLNARWEALPTLVDELMQTAEKADSDVTHLLPPNYDRPCLNKLERGSNTTSGLLGMLGGALGNIFGGEIQNNVNADVSQLHSVINTLAEEVNGALQAADQSQAAYVALGRLVTERIYDPELTGGGVEGQIQVVETLYQQQQSDDARRTTMLHDVALAAETLRCYGEVYNAFLMDDQEQRDFISRLSNYRREFDGILTSFGVTVADCLSQEELAELYQRVIGHQQRLGLQVEANQVWDTSSTMQTGLLAYGTTEGASFGTHKMLTTWRTQGKVMMYATDPKNGATAFYGFSRSGQPMCFSRGGQVILFDWTKADGSTLYSNMEEGKVTAVYTFACFLRDKCNGFTNRDYQRYQTAY